jgi:hypothetical protein
MRRLIKQLKVVTGESSRVAGTRPAPGAVTARTPQQQERIRKAVEDIERLAEEVKRMNPVPPKETSTDTLHKMRYGQSD